MDDQPQFRYYKRSDTAESAPWVIWRSAARFAGFERWNGTEWVEDPDVFYKLQGEYDYWDATEEEALQALPVLSARYREGEVRRERENLLKAEQVRVERRIKLEELALAREEGTQLDGLDGSPFPALHLAAIAMHELFLSLTVAGFTDEQALALIGHMVSNSPRSDPKAT